MRTLQIISDFNAGPVGGYLTSKLVDVDCAVSVAPFGQVYQCLGLVDSNADFSFVWTRAEGVIPSFRRVLDMTSVSEEEVLADVDAFADALVRHADGVLNCFATSWVIPEAHRGYGMLDWRRGLGVSNLLARMNLRLADRVASSENIFLLDPTRWLHAAGKPASPKMWFATKVPYTNETFGAAASDILHAIHAVEGTSRRLIVVDLDNTLWGGVVGETGWEGLRLGGHDHIGEAYVGFQNALKALSRKGIQLAIASKNDEAVALEAIEDHPEMVLRKDDFAAWRINWQDKAQNIVELAEELRLGLESVVFLDDNPAERDRVRTALPDVFVPEWPSDPCKYESALRAFGEFDVASLNDEDRGRTAMYAKDRERRNVAGLSDSVEAYLERLGTSVVVTPLDKATLPRVAQLFNKTNQLNMATRRLTGEEIAAWAREPFRSLFSLSVSDQFGDLGLTGIVSVEVEEQEAKIVDYVLSCRVMGREIEEMMIYLAVEAARDLGASSVTARYEQTKRNAPTLEVLRGSNLTELDEGVFSWDARNPYPKPLSIGLLTNAAALQ